MSHRQRFQGTGRLLDGDREIAHVVYDVHLTDDVLRLPDGTQLEGTPSFGGTLRGDPSRLAVPDDTPLTLMMDDHKKQVLVYIDGRGGLTLFEVGTAAIFSSVCNVVQQPWARADVVRASPSPSEDRAGRC